MDPSAMRDFASVALDAGLAVEAGTMLSIGGEFPHREIMYAIAEAAYDRGARVVKIEYDDVRLARIRADRARDEYLESLSAMVEKDCEIYVEEAWSYLRIEGYERPDAMEGVDQDRLVRMQRSRGRASRVLRDAQMSGRLPWCVIPYPTEAWAGEVLGPGAEVSDLWRALVPILRLDRPDPVEELRACIDGSRDEPETWAPSRCALSGSEAPARTSASRSRPNPAGRAAPTRRPREKSSCPTFPPKKCSRHRIFAARRAPSR